MPFSVPLAWYASTYSGNDLRYLGLGVPSQRTAAVQAYVPVTRAAKLTRLAAYVASNTKDGVTLFRAYLNGVGIAPLSVPAGTTGFFDSGFLDLAIPADSLICVQHDTTASAAGSYSVFEGALELGTA